MKVKLIDVLVMTENGTLKDDERVIIDDDLYFWNSKDKKLTKEELKNFFLNMKKEGLKKPTRIILPVKDYMETYDIPTDTPLDLLKYFPHEIRYLGVIQCNLKI